MKTARSSSSPSCWSPPVGGFYIDSIAKEPSRSLEPVPASRPPWMVPSDYRSGSAGLKGLAVANPDGYKSPEFFKLSKAVSPASLLTT
jgi:hypothetical protein